MHELLGVGDRAAVGLGEGLVAQADPEQRLPGLLGVVDQGGAHAGVGGGPGTLAEAYGGTVTHAEELMHGKTSRVEHDGTSVFDAVPSPFTATRYHSLAVVDRSVPDVLEVTARTSNGVVMGLRHRSAPLHGVQFHPESVLTEGGYLMLGNWLELVGLEGAASAAASLSPLITA